MSFDIYGNNLRRGYCEVHPNVHEEYPCSVGISENKRQQSPHPDPRDELQHYLELAIAEIAQLKQENAELKARDSISTVALFDLAYGLPDSKTVYKLKDIALEAYQNLSHPIESLDSIKAEGIIEAVNKFPVALRKMWSASEVVNWLVEYANNWET